MSVRSEADQLASQLITVTVTSELDPKICQYNEGHLYTLLNVVIIKTTATTWSLHTDRLLKLLLSPLRCPCALDVGVTFGVMLSAIMCGFCSDSLWS